MTYRNELNQAGVTVDGVPDTIDPGAPPAAERGGYVWEQLSGAQGTVSIITSLKTDVEDFSVTGYYLDQSAPTDPAEAQCTGDDAAFGSSGLWIDSPIPNTDPVIAPANDPANNLVSTRSFFYDPPDAGGAAAAQRREAEVARPLRVKAAPLVAEPAALTLKAKAPTDGKLVPSEFVKVKMTIKNTGGSPATAIKACVKGKRSRLSGFGCERLESLPAGEGVKLTRKLKVKRRAKGGKVKLKVNLRAAGIGPLKDTTTVKIV